nr:lipocalin family protein [Sphingomonas chungangi]
MTIAVTPAIASSAQATTPTAPEPSSPVDASKLFVGQWVEIGRKPMKLTNSCVAGGTRYTSGKNGHVNVVDTCHEKTPAGKLKSISGPGTILNPGVNTKLHVAYRFLGFLPVGRDYWILDHDDAYSWFISSNPQFTDLWIYTRDARPSPSLVKTLVGKAKSMGYDVSQLEFPAQP